MMKLLLFSDLHCDIGAAQALVRIASEVDVVIGAGDFGQCRSGIGDTIQILRNIAKPVVLVPGNAESVEELAEACRDWKSAHVLHGSGVEIDGVPFFGIGGGIPVTPFGAWSYDFTEEQAAGLLADCPEYGVLVSHSPPKGACDVDASGNSFGSQAVRDTILAKSPQLVVCGHIHQCWRKQAEVGSSVVINAGPRGIEWSLKPTVPRGS